MITLKQVKELIDMVDLEHKCRVAGTYLRNSAGEMTQEAVDFLAKKNTIAGLRHAKDLMSKDVLNHCLTHQPNFKA